MNSPNTPPINSPYVFRHINKPLAGKQIRPFHKPTVIKIWGPRNDEELWATAVLFKGRWRILQPAEECQFEYIVSEDGKSLDGLKIWMKDRLIEEY
ncbi:MAG: hypothetical protein HYX26_10425 [Acidobacteriales bacterium]|nr:hypothetical protein [Terriglobales bacterium]